MQGRSGNHLLGDLTGAFGDIGTLLPLTLGLIFICGFDATSIFFTFGLLYAVAGILYRIPMPVQPMKVVAAMAILLGLSQQDVRAVGLALGLIFILLATSGAITFVRRVPTAIAVAIIFSVGLKLAMTSFGYIPLDGLHLIPLAVFVLLLLVLLRTHLENKALFILPAALILGSFSPPLGFVANEASAMKFSLPPPPLSPNFVEDFLLVGTPQLLLTLTNAILGTAFLAAILFPSRVLSIKRLSITHGLMNLLSSFLGGIPVCHGSGGLAGHYYFGARTEKATIFLGCSLLILSLSGIALPLLSEVPSAVLGFLLLYTGLLMSKVILKLRSKREYAVAFLVSAMAVLHIDLLILGVVLGSIALYLIEGGKPRTVAEFVTK